jgi:hypothetical protein
MKWSTRWLFLMDIWSSIYVVVIVYAFSRVIKPWPAVAECLPCRTALLN